MKCIAQSVIDITAIESKILLVDEKQPNFASEFQALLNNLGVLLELRKLVSSDNGISACIVPNNEACVSFAGLQREVLVKSIAYELKYLAPEVQTALRDRYSI